MIEPLIESKSSLGWRTHIDLSNYHYVYDCSDSLFFLPTAEIPLYRPIDYPTDWNMTNMPTLLGMYALYGLPKATFENLIFPGRFADVTWLKAQLRNVLCDEYWTIHQILTMSSLGCRPRLMLQIHVLRRLRGYPPSPPTSSLPLVVFISLPHRAWAPLGEFHQTSKILPQHH